MTEKVVITQAQANSIELYRNTGEKSGKALAEVYLDGMFITNRCLIDLTFDDLMKAFFVGYEVEPEYSPGDWVAVNYRDQTKVERILNVYRDSGVLEFDRDTLNVYVTEDIRHATDYEIAAEKERRSEVKLSEILHDLTIKEKQRLRQILNS